MSGGFWFNLIRTPKIGTPNYKTGPFGGSPKCMKPDVKSMPETGASLSSVWFKLGRCRPDLDKWVSIGDLPSCSNQTPSLCRRPVCHLVEFGFNSGDADRILTNGCL